MKKNSSDYKKVLYRAALIWGVEQEPEQLQLFDPDELDSIKTQTELSEAMQVAFFNEALETMVAQSFKELEDIVLSPKQLLGDDFAKRKAELMAIEKKLVTKYGVTNALKISVNGRNYDLAGAVRFDFKNNIINNMLDSQMAALDEYEHNLVKINYNSVCSPMCINRQNRIYWTKINDPNYSPLDPELFKNGGGLFHPHCRHYIVAYFPGESDPVVSPVDKQAVANAYAEDQKIKYQKRVRKKYKQRMAQAKAVGDINAYNYNLKLWRKWK